MNFFKKIVKKLAGLFKGLLLKCKTNIPFTISLTVFAVSFIVFVALVLRDVVQINRIGSINSNYKDIIQNAELSKKPTPTDTVTPSPTDAPVYTPDPSATPTPTFTPTPTPSPTPAMTAGGLAAYEKNHDYVGWLEIPGEYDAGDSRNNRVDHPVFQTFDDPATPYDPNNDDSNEAWYYLYRDPEGNPNRFGSLFVDDRCTIGTGTAETNYEHGVKPSANIIIYGHNYVRFVMFGSLKQYWTKNDFYDGHKIIKFTTCYEDREYEVISYYEDRIPEDDTFYYASFVNCYTQEDFDTWYKFIKDRSVRNTGVTAEFGDEFITLVTCATAETENPRRTVVVAKRTK